MSIYANRILQLLQIVRSVTSDIARNSNLYEKILRRTKDRKEFIFLRLRPSLSPSPLPRTLFIRTEVALR